MQQWYQVYESKDKTVADNAKMQRFFFKIPTKPKNTKLEDKSLRKPDTNVSEINRCYTYVYIHIYIYIPGPFTRESQKGGYMSKFSKLSLLFMAF